MVICIQRKDFWDQEISSNRNWWFFYIKMVIFDQNLFSTREGFWIWNIKATGEWNIFQYVWAINNDLLRITIIHGGFIKCFFIPSKEGV